MPTIDDYESAKRLLRELKRMNKQEATTIQHVRDRYTSKRVALVDGATAAVRSIVDETLRPSEQTSGSDMKSDWTPAAPSGPENGGTNLAWLAEPPKGSAPIEPAARKAK